jgi:glycine C-acetyltransferase
MNLPIFIGRFILLRIKRKAPRNEGFFLKLAFLKNSIMISKKYLETLQEELQAIKEEGLFKNERIITSQQAAEIEANGKQLLNFCANNYLGLSNNPEVMKASQDMVESHGYGLSSVRFICGTQDIHKQLESKISTFLGLEDTILYAACFDANGGVFEPLFTDEDAIISDSLNHASIIDGVRLCKAARYRYQNNNMEDLEAQLKIAAEKNHRFRIIVTDGVFSMDGIVADLKGICDLADKYDCMVMVDDCHATGFIGKTGRGTHEANDVMGRVDLITSTLGKALGGALGGFTSGKKEIIDMLRQRSRPYLFSNSLPPGIVGAALKVLEMISDDTSLRDKVMANAEYFRKEMKAKGFDCPDGDAAIVPVMLYDAPLAQKMAEKLMDEGIYVIGFFYPVVPKGKARIRVQLSAAHTQAHLDKAIAAFEKVGKELGVFS